MKLIPTPKPLPAGNKSLSQGVELAASVAVFFLLGFGLDAWWGTTPFLMIAFVVFAMVGQSVKMYFAYSSDMKRLEAERVEAGRGSARG